MRGVHLLVESAAPELPADFLGSFEKSIIFAGLI